MRASMEGGHVIHIGRVDFRNDDRIFGIKDEDRFLHIYIMEKTGTGKSTLLETMALQDLERGNDFAFIDPHGDLVARIAARIPPSLRDKVIYLDATDPNQPYGYNPLRHVSEDRIALAASGMMLVLGPASLVGYASLRLLYHHLSSSSAPTSAGDGTPRR